MIVTSPRASAGRGEAPIVLALTALLTIVITHVLTDLVIVTIVLALVRA